MKISQEQFIGLWKTSLFPLSFRNPKWILESFWTPALILLVSAATDNFNKMTITKYSLFFGVVSIISLMIYVALRLIISHRILEKYAYQSMLILYVTYDAMMLAALGLSITIMGLMMLTKYSNIADEKIETISFVIYIYLLFVSVLAFIVSPRFFILKSQSMLKGQKASSKKETLLIFLMGMAPGIGMMFSTFFSKDNMFLVNFVAGFSFLLATIVLFIAMSNFRLIYMFLINKWPKIVKSDSKFVVVED